MQSTFTRITITLESEASWEQLQFWQQSVFNPIRTGIKTGGHSLRASFIETSVIWESTVVMMTACGGSIEITD